MGLTAHQNQAQANLAVFGFTGIWSTYRGGPLNLPAALHLRVETRGKRKQSVLIEFDDPESCRGARMLGEFYNSGFDVQAFAAVLAAADIAHARKFLAECKETRPDDADYCDEALDAIDKGEVASTSTAVPPSPRREVIRAKE